MRMISELDFMQMITKNLQRLNIFEKSSADLSSQNFMIVIQNYSASDTAACRSSTNAMIFVNLVSELIYFNLVENELSASMNDRMIFFMRNTLMLYS